MKHITILFILALFTSCFNNKSKTFSIDRWKAGDSASYHVEFVDFEFLNDSIVHAKSNYYKATLNILTLGKSNVLEWHIRQPLMKSDSLISDLERVVGDTVDYMETLKIKYQVNANGEFEKVVNWPDLEMYVNAYWDSLILNNTLDQTKRKGLDEIRNTFSNRPVVEAQMTRDIQALHLIFNKPFVNGDYEEDIIGLNEEIIPSTIKILILGAENDFKYIRITRELNSAPLSLQLNDFASNLTKDTSPVDIFANDTAFIEFNSTISLPTNVEYWRVIKIANKHRRIGVSLKQLH